MIANDLIISLRNLPSDHYKIVAVAATNLKSAEEFAKQHNISKGKSEFIYNSVHL